MPNVDDKEEHGPIARLVNAIDRQTQVLVDLDYHLQSVIGAQNNIAQSIADLGSDINATTRALAQAMSQAEWDTNTGKIGTAFNSAIQYKGFRNTPS